MNLNDLDVEINITKTCKDCGKTFSKTVCKVFQAYVIRCDTCVEIEIERLQNEQRHQAELELRNQWATICPPEFQNTRLDKLPRLPRHNEALCWKFGHRGLLLHGPSGTGKSRAAWSILQREFMGGRSVKVMNYFSGIEYASRFGVSSNAVEEWISERGRCGILFMDDIFKAKFTDSYEGALFAIISMRTEHRRPIIITSNDTATSLSERLSGDRGEPMIRRLKEYCQPVSFE